MHVASSHRHLPPMKTLKPGGGGDEGSAHAYSNVGSEYAVCCSWQLLERWLLILIAKICLTPRCIVFRLGIIGMMKRILGSMIR